MGACPLSFAVYEIDFASMLISLQAVFVRLPVLWLVAELRLIRRGVLKNGRHKTGNITIKKSTEN